MLSLRNRAAAVVLAAAGVCVCARAQQEPRSAASYWPFREGNTWTIVATLGERKMTQIITVAKVTKEGDRTRAELEYKTEGRSTQREIYDVDSTSIRRVASGPEAGNKLNPPLPVVQLPMKAGQKWSWKGNVTFVGTTVNGSAQLSVSGPETVKTGAGSFAAMRVHVDLDMEAGEKTIKVLNDYWFAPRVGLVRQKATIGNQVIEGLMTSYKLAK